EPCDGAAVFQGRLQLAVMVVEHLVDHAQSPRNLCYLLLATQRKRSTRGLPVTDVAIGSSHQFDVMSLFRPLHCHTRSAILRIVRMRAEDDDAQFTVAG